MKVSIITACYNSAATIEDTIRSVQSQTYPDIEYIIVDGASKDDTLSIVDGMKERISKVHSGKDEGIYDAMNKGIAMATGDIIGILNSDDVYENEKVIEQVVQVFDSQPVDTVYGDLVYVAEDDLNRVIRYWKSGNYYRRAFLNGWMPPHPTFFVKREVYKRFGTFDTEFKTSADYEFMLRVLFKNHCSSSYLNKILVRMRMGGQSNENLLNRILANQEDRKAWLKNGINPKFYTLGLKPLRKLNQFFKRP
jgi:glycosyltransferase